MKKYIPTFVAIIFLVACNDRGQTTANNTDSSKMTNSEMVTDTVKAKQELTAMVDDIHNLFKKKNSSFIDKYMSKDGLYMGTDPKELWRYNDFKTYVDEKVFKDTAIKISDYTISHHEIDIHGSSAVVVEEFMLPELFSSKMMVRTIGHARYENGKWIFDMYSWNFIPKNEDLRKIDKAL